MAGAGAGPERDFRAVLLQAEEQAKKHPGHDAELAALRKDYAQTQAAISIEEKVRPIFDRCSQEVSGVPAIVSDPKAMKELREQMEQLGREGWFKERKELAKRTNPTDEMRAKRKADNFGFCKECFEQAAAHGYLTRISIHQDPSLWTY